METKKFKINKESENGGKKKITKSSMFSKAGFTFAGGIAGAAFTTAANGMSPNPEEQVATEPVTEQQQVQQPEPSKPEPIEPEPIVPDPDGPTPNPNNPTLNPENPDYIDPNEVAEILTQEIDSEDIDDDLVFTPDSYGEAYMPDGTRQFAVFGHLPDGTQIALLDIDGDGIFGDFFDAGGNLIGQIEEGLSISDILDMADDSGGYLAGLNEPWEEEEITEGVSGEQEIADIEEEVDEDELLAQLTEDVDDEESSELDRFFEDTETDEGTEVEEEPEDEEEEDEESEEEGIIEEEEH